jgi:hypothetical protein
MNGYGTIDRMYRPLGIGTIKAQDKSHIIFTPSAVQGGAEGFDKLVQNDKVWYQIFGEHIAGANFASDVRKK